MVEVKEEQQLLLFRFFSIVETQELPEELIILSIRSTYRLVASSWIFLLGVRVDLRRRPWPVSIRPTFELHISTLQQV